MSVGLTARVTTENFLAVDDNLLVLAYCTDMWAAAETDSGEAAVQGASTDDTDDCAEMVLHGQVRFRAYILCKPRK